LNPHLEWMRRVSLDDEWPRWLYLEEDKRNELTNYEHGCLLSMDMDPAVAFVKDSKGMWFREDARRLEDGTHDLAYSTKIINSLIRKGWVVEAGTYDEKMRPLKVWRSAKPGSYIYGREGAGAQRFTEPLS